MAKFLEVNPDRKDSNQSITQDDINNKMLEGTRADQRDETRAPVRKPVMQTPNKVLRLASELNVDLAKVVPTGADGRQITEEDVRKAADDPAKQLPSAPKINDTRTARTSAEANRSTQNTAANPNTPNTADTRAKTPGAGPTSTNS